MHKYQQLNFWKKSKDLSILVYEATTCFPIVEQYSLTNQLRRSAVSIPSNIAEGASRSSNKEFKRFIEIANGSAYELQTQLLISKEVGYLESEKYEVLNAELLSVIQMMNKFKSRL